MKNHLQPIVHSLLVTSLLLSLFSSSTQVSAQIPASPNPLRGYWQFEQNLNDSSPNHNDGASTEPIMYALGIVGDALSRDGTQPSITLPDFGNNNSLNLENSAITIEAWIKSSNFGDDFRHLIDNVDGYALSVFEGRVAMLGPDFWWTPIDTTGPNTEPLTNPVLSPGAWHYVAGTYDGSKQALYVDGQLVAYRNTLASVPAGWGNIGIAGYGGGGFDYAFSGLIDELRVFDYARSAAAIAADYEDLTSSSPVRMRVTDSAGNLVSELMLNDDGWPVLNAADGTTVANPLMVKITLSCPIGNSLCNSTLSLTITSSPWKARFYVVEGACVSGASEPSLITYVAICGSEGYVNPGEAKELQWSIWVQPSEAADLQFSATWGDIGTALSTVQVPKAAIHPIIFLPGLGATNPPMYVDYHNVLGTNLAITAGLFAGDYRKFFPALEKLGYKRNQTYFIFAYDWLVETPQSAEVLHDDLVVPAAREIADPMWGVPYVVGYGSPDGQDVTFDLIGHSTGNLIARSYIQVPEDLAWDGHVHRFVSLAGPHKGLPKGFVAFEGIEPEDVLIPTDILGHLGLFYGERRAQDADYGEVVCSLIWGCRWQWGIEDKYLFTHDPEKGPTSLVGFLPTYTETAYLSRWTEFLSHLDGAKRLIFRRFCRAKCDIYCGHLLSRAF